MPIGLENLNNVFILKPLNQLQIIFLPFETDLVGEVPELFPREFRSLVFRTIGCKSKILVLLMRESYRVVQIFFDKPLVAGMDLNFVNPPI